MVVITVMAAWLGICKLQLRAMRTRANAYALCGWLQWTGAGGVFERTATPICACEFAL